MAKLWMFNPETGEGKYLVKRRDGTVPVWPHFVLGGADPIAPWALRAYAVVAALWLWDWEYARSVWRCAGVFAAWRKGPGRQEKKGDPNAAPHRADDYATIVEMRKGFVLGGTPPAESPTKVANKVLGIEDIPRLYFVQFLERRDGGAYTATRITELFDAVFAGKPLSVGEYEILTEAIKAYRDDIPL